MQFDVEIIKKNESCSYHFSPKVRFFFLYLSLKHRFLGNCVALLMVSKLSHVWWTTSQPSSPILIAR